MEISQKFVAFSEYMNFTPYIYVSSIFPQFLTPPSPLKMWTSFMDDPIPKMRAKITSDSIKSGQICSLRKIEQKIKVKKLKRVSKINQNKKQFSMYYILLSLINITMLV